MPKYTIYAHKLGEAENAGYAVFAELDGKPVLKIDRVDSQKEIKDLQIQLGRECDCEVRITESVPSRIGPPPSLDWIVVDKDPADVAVIHDRVSTGMKVGKADEAEVEPAKN